MGLIRAVRGLSPSIGKDVFIAENATLIGDVRIGDQVSIWYNVVIRGDVHVISVGARTNIQDNTVIHATYQIHPTIIEEDVTIGHSVLLHGCRVKKGSLIGMGAIVMDGAEIGEYSLVGAGALVTEGKKFPPYSLILGRPASKKRDLTEDEVKMLKQSIQNYLLYKSWYE
jgi:carbonic anhydrase/acetyltransferase-like protein (isoleucine patch superfamily)